jgi:predicted nucleic-acid-binding protein
MIAVDTNVWARAYLNDDIAQAKKARSAIKHGCLKGGVFVPLIVLAELFWVLRSQWEKERALRALKHLLETEGVVVEAPAIVAKALDAASNGAVGFADLLIAHVAFANGVDEVVTFDNVLGRQPRVRRLS